MKKNTIGILQKCSMTKLILKRILTVCIVLISFLKIQANTYSQNVKLSLNLQNTTVQKVFEEIEGKTEFKFFYKKEAVDLNRVVSISVSKKELSYVLELLFKGTNTSYEVLDKQIMVKQALKESGVKEDKTKLKKESLQKTVSGKVVDVTGMPLFGANVAVKGSTTGTQTDVEGNFSINATKGETLVFSYIGFVAQSYLVGDATTIKIILKENSAELTEVVVTAYGKVKKGSLTDAVSSINAEKLQDRPIKNLAEGLIGLAPGLNIRMPSGAPESNPIINIRGFTAINSSGSPLILVDGIERPIEDVNPNDVVNVSVLKDGASTAIYGSRAPYGIILITTKNGKKGKLSVDYRTNFKVGKLVLAPTQPDSPTWARYINEAQLNGRPDGTGTIGVDDLTIQRMEAWLSQDWNNAAFDDLRSQFGDKAQQYIENGQFPTTNAGYKFWTREQSFASNNLYDSYFKKASVSTQHDISFSGGAERVNYFTSFGYTGTDGLLQGDTNFNNRYNSHVKVNFEASHWLDLRTDVNYVRQINQGPNYRGASSTDPGSGNAIADYGSIFSSMTQYFATPLQVPSGKTYSWILGAASILGEGGLINNTRNDLTLSAGATIKITKGLELSGDYTFRNKNSEFAKVDKIVFVEQPDGTLVQNSRSANVSRTTKSFNTDDYEFIKFNAQYQKTFAKKHNLFVQVGMQVEEDSYEALTGSRDGLFAPDVTTAISTASTNPQVRDNLYSWSTLGYYGVLTYDYEQKYLIKLAGRRDASSRFAPEARWGAFPSVSGAWNVAKESFWPLKEVISTFKPRASWSTSGDLASAGSGNYYTYLPTLTLGTSSGTLLGGNFANYATPPGLISSTLTWAKPETIDFGLDITALNNRLTLGYDWYQRTVKDQVGPPNPLPLTLGTGAPRLNNSVSETRGWEFSLSWNDQFTLAGDPFRYNVGFQMSDYIGYVTKYSENKTGVRSGVWTPGELFGQNYVYESAGIAQSISDLNGKTLTGTYNYPGYLQYKDLNGDGYINSGNGGFWYSQGDRKTNGFNYPRKSYSITPSFSWNNFSFSAVFDGVLEWKIYNSSEYVWGTRAGVDLAYFYTPAFKESTDLGYWRPDNTNAFFPSFNTGKDSATDQYTLDLSHLRIRNITIGYDLPAELLKKTSLNKLRFYFSGENLGFVYNNSFIKYDPELLSSGVNGYPPLRYYSFGVNIGL